MTGSTGEMVAVAHPISVMYNGGCWRHESRFSEKAKGGRQMRRFWRERREEREREREISSLGLVSGQQRLIHQQLHTQKQPQPPLSTFTKAMSDLVLRLLYSI